MQTEQICGQPSKRRRLEKVNPAKFFFDNLEIAGFSNKGRFMDIFFF